MTKFSLPTVLAAAALVIAPSIANAETASTSVSYADLNMSSPQGQATMKSRIALAVTKVCGSTAGNIELSQRMEISKCRAKASHDAFAAAKINQPVFASR